MGFFLFFAITGPSLPYELGSSDIAESPDGRGVLLFGGRLGSAGDTNKILELRAGADSWDILDATLQEGRYSHTVIPFP